MVVRPYANKLPRSDNQGCSMEDEKPPVPFAIATDVVKDSEEAGTCCIRVWQSVWRQ